MATPTPASNLRNLPRVGPKPGPSTREVLKEELEDLQEHLANERVARGTAAKKAEALRQRMARLAAMQDDLEAARSQHNSYVSAKAATQAERAKGLGPEGHGMLTFTEHFGEGNVKVRPVIAGRASRRTAFSTDYCGRPILGSCESLEKRKLQEKANVVLANRESERRERSRDVSPVAAHTPEPTSLYRLRTKPRLAASSMKPAGGPGDLPDLQGKFKQRSTRRTRFYTNYEGTRINMDPCDWPEQHDFVLTGC